MVHGGNTTLQPHLPGFKYIGKYSRYNNSERGKARDAAYRARNHDKIIYNRVFKWRTKRNVELEARVSALFSSPDIFIRLTEDAYGSQFECRLVRCSGAGDEHIKVGRRLYNVTQAAIRRGWIQPVRSATVHHDGIGDAVDYIYYQPVMEEQCPT